MCSGTKLCFLILNDLDGPDYGLQTIPDIAEANWFR